MKNFYYVIFILLLSFLFFVCNGDNPVTPAPPPKPETGTLIINCTVPDAAQADAQTSQMVTNISAKSAEILLIAVGKDSIVHIDSLTTLSFSDTIKDIPMGDDWYLKTSCINSHHEILYIAEQELEIEQDQIKIINLQLDNKWGTVKDYDGNVYQTVKIGSQRWMAENLKVKHYQNGDAIEQVTSPQKWQQMHSTAWCYLNNDHDNEAVYGLLYNGFAVQEKRQIAPDGWHISSDNDWKVLERYLGVEKSKSNSTGLRFGDEGCKLKIDDQDFWDISNVCNTTHCGFNALPGGSREISSSTPLQQQNSAYFWTHTSNIAVYCRILERNVSGIYREIKNEKIGMSIRCVLD